MKLFQLLLILILFTTISCRNKTETIPEPKGNKIKMIVVDFFPAFHQISTAIVDMKEGTITFKRFAFKTNYRPKGNTDIEKITSIKSINFQLDSCSYSYLNDSILFAREDFIDRKEEVNDGISNTMLYIFEDNSIQDVDLFNDITENQKQFITKIIDLTITQTTEDSLENSYFKRLREYY